MIESKRSIALNAICLFLLILAIVIVLPLIAPPIADAASPSAGIDVPLSTVNEPPAVWSTPPPTDATTVTVTLTDGGWLSVFVLTGAAVVGLLATLRRLPQ